MKTEVLAPAGSKEGLFAALCAGADAVYAGGGRFGARAYAQNFSDEELSECIDECHLHGKKLYLTINTLMKEQELSMLLDWLVPFYEQGLDAVIVQDLGVAALLRRELPELDIHASTQMSIHSASGARMLEKLGITRVVPARELSLLEIQNIRQETSLEIECFVHGALCYSYSGQCLLSSLIGGRSGNRGRCAQPCRLPWTFDGGKEAFLLSPKDICTLEILPDILDAGVDSLKIEGRMKRMEYTAGVSEMYRKYVDMYHEKGREGYRVDPEDIRNLMDLYNRGGFSTGYYRQKNGISMMSTKRQNHFGTKGAMLIRQKGRETIWKALEPLYPGDMLESGTLTSGVKKGKEFSIHLKEGQKLQPKTVWNRTYHAPLMERLHTQYTDRRLQEKINGKLMISSGKPAILSVSTQENGVTVTGAVVQSARKQPVTEETLRRQFCKTGGTAYVFDRLDIEAEDGCFLPVQSQNELRREALAQLAQKQLEPFRRKLSPKPEGSSVCQEQTACQEAETCPNAGIPEFSVSLERTDAFGALSVMEGIDRIYLDSKCFSGFGQKETLQKMHVCCEEHSRSLWYILPAVFRQETEALYRKQKDWLSCFDGILVKNLEELQFLQDIAFPGKIACDYNFYTCSREAAKLFCSLGASFTTGPVEWTQRELAAFACPAQEFLVYGRIPVMTSAQCLLKTTGGCSGVPGVHILKDRKGKKFPVKNCCDFCFNVIYNSVPLSLHGMSEEVSRLSFGSVRLMFTVESKQEILKITEQFLQEYVFGKKAGAPDYEFTRGHFKRGVE